MHFQQRYNSQAVGYQFGDLRTMRTPVEGTVSREAYDTQQRLDDRINTGRELDNSAYVMRVPDGAVEHFHGMEALVERGRDRFNIYCTPCHGRSGDGLGMVFVRSRTSGYQYPQPPTFHQDRLRHEPDGQVFATITNGVRNMPSYAAQVPVYDRWAIVSYMRALQLSQGGPLAPTTLGAAQ